jgi:hypothetical protein
MYSKLFYILYCSFVKLYYVWLNLWYYYCNCYCYFTITIIITTFIIIIKARMAWTIVSHLLGQNRTIVSHLLGQNRPKRTDPTRTRVKIRVMTVRIFRQEMKLLISWNCDQVFSLSKSHLNNCIWIKCEKLKGLRWGICSRSLDGVGFIKTLKM